MLIRQIATKAVQQNLDQITSQPVNSWRTNGVYKELLRSGDSLLFLTQSTNRLRQCCFCGFNTGKVSPICHAPPTI
jgi:hypothetical protein